MTTPVFILTLEMCLTLIVFSPKMDEITNQGRWDSEEFTVRALTVSREVHATYIKDESSLEIAISLPSTYPLVPVEVSCLKQRCVSKKQWRHWQLMIIILLEVRNGSMLDAVLLWKRNIDREFEGREPCVICYSVVEPRTMALPSLTCATCANQFHTMCLYKWFSSSHKSDCPLCQQSWKAQR